MPKRAETRVEERSDGWYDPERGVVLPLLNDIYEQTSLGAGGLVWVIRDLQRQITELDRRGA